MLRDAGGTHRQRAGAPLAVDHQPVEEPGPDAPSRPRRGAANDDERVAARVMQRYEERLAAYQAVDFDDLIGLPLKLLQRDAEARDASGRSTLRYVLVDEYQDTNAVQYELLKLLVGERGRCSPRSATTTRASTAGAARPSTT